MFSDQRDEDCRKNQRASNGKVNRPILLQPWENQVHNNQEDIFHCVGWDYGPKEPERWCDQYWPENYHGTFWLYDVCPQYKSGFSAIVENEEKLDGI